ncbi:MAG: hypothetical protein MUF24_04555 [Chitinophagaceae bacterium]|nr:hypothetical protein [Chitinophagaceae bacterium]
MIIANPIYDTVFKRLMENDKVAKFFIGTLLEQQIEGLAVFRLDFIATIRGENGEIKKVLIEIQKAKNQIDLMRFRNYLGEQYKKEDQIEGEKMVLPITTIYILGFSLPEIDSPCIRVERQYKDLITKSIIEKKSEFVEKLTHDCFIVQVDRITDRYQTSLDKLLSVFEQNNFIDEKKITKQFQHPSDNEYVKLMTDILHHSGTNPEERKRIEAEQEAWRTVNAMFEDKEKAFLKALQEKEKALDEKEKALDEKEKALAKSEEMNADLLRQIEQLKQNLKK